MNKKENRGGYRKNAKRPLKYIEKSKLFYKLVPMSKHEEINTIVDKICNPFLAKNNFT